MIKDVIVVLSGLLIILGTMVFCGCLSTEVEDKDYEDVTLESDVIQLNEYSLDFEKNKNGDIIKATVNGIIENTRNKVLNVEITGRFYDENDAFLGEKTYTIFGLRIKPNPGYSTTFSIVYEEGNASRVDHVRLYAVDKSL